MFDLLFMRGGDTLVLSRRGVEFLDLSPGELGSAPWPATRGRAGGLRRVDRVALPSAHRAAPAGRLLGQPRAVQRHVPAQITAVTEFAENTVAARYRRAALHKLRDLLSAEIAALFAAAT